MHSSSSQMILSLQIKQLMMMMMKVMIMIKIVIGFIHSCVNAHLGCFLVLVIVNSAAMNIREHVSKKWWSIYIYNEVLLSHKKECNNAICSNTNGPRVYDPKWSKAKRERQILYDITYMCNLRHDIKELIYKAETDLQTQKINFWLPNRKVVGRNKLGVLD